MKGLKDLEKLVDDGTTVVTIATPKGWRCERPNCAMDYLHTHGTYSTLKEKQYVFLRYNMGSHPTTPPSRITEKEARLMIGVCVRDVNRAINKLKRGGELRTRYATYAAREIE